MSTTTLRLYEIASELRALDDAITDADGEVTPEIEAALDAWTAPFAEKADNLCALIREHERAVEAAKAEADRLYALAQSHRREADRWKAYLRRCMEIAGLDRVAGDRFKASLCRSTPAIRWTRDPHELPEACRKVPTPEPNLMYVKSVLEETGELIPGFEVVEGRHLRIR